MNPETAPTALERLIREGSEADLRRFLLLLEPPEIADIIEALESPDDRARAFRAIVGTKRPSVLRDIEEGEREDLLEVLDPAETAKIVTDMQSDDAADVLLDMDEEQKEEVLRQIPAEERARIDTVLSYEEECAGGIMQTELVKVREDETVRNAVSEIRRTRDEVGELHEIFVVDNAQHLKGWVKERALILADDDDLISTITRAVPVKVPVTMDQEEIADLVRDYDLSSVPVVDDHNVLVGRILVDDIVDVVTEEATEDITRLGGTDPEEIYTPSVRQALRSRAPWLVVPLLGGIAASVIFALGEEPIRRAGILFAFIPVIIGMAGGSSVQAATVAVRSLALGRIDYRDLWHVMLRELGTATVLALGIAACLWVVAAVVDQDLRVAWIVGISTFGTICLGMVFAVFTPIFLHRVGADPAVATSPFVTTMNDLLGASIILGVVLLLL
ncbi:MAG: magnesium transporter [Planctomycetota bacterium]|jgi:magnesium transporter